MIDKDQLILRDFFNLGSDFFSERGIIGEVGEQNIPIIATDGCVYKILKEVGILIMHANGNFSRCADSREESFHDIKLVLAHLVHENDNGLQACQETVFYVIPFSPMGNQDFLPD